ncbi:MAG: NAD(P)/FAD-dependent oxidoreductase [Gammaproteobacteria bacterium]|jgi:L-2-hydroxyglutarate oxidase LhgO|nr:NAD(P)/FAD-dependent oxidoreductase [Gammaproteobacteria bacterium]MDP7297218.1 NAD(P)/FAD-dependent oxidoreductase [Gammaproteobacteria bacterium]
MHNVDCIVVGAGVIGLATARALALTGHEVVVLEAEAGIGTHASSRNSEVIHAGIYYPPGSQKAMLCHAGQQKLYGYCRDKAISYKRLGKLILAVSADEVNILQQYRARAIENGLQDLIWLDRDQVSDLEPEVKCTSALLSPSTGIVDTHAFMVSLQADIEASGGAVICRSPVCGIDVADAGFMVRVTGDEEHIVSTRLLVNAAGLWAPTVAAAINALDQQLIPVHRFAKGHYYRLSGQAPFHRLIYPIAGAAGLGIHLTLDLAGQGRFGPDVQWVETLDYDFDNTRKAEFVDAIRRYYPDLDESLLTEAYTGIRPKLCGPAEPAADFLIQGPGQHGIGGLVNLYGIESPGLTSALAIADRVTAVLSTG